MSDIQRGAELDREAADAVRNFTEVLAGLRVQLEEHESDLREHIETVVQALPEVVDRLENGAQSVVAFAEAFAAEVRRQVEEAVAGNAAWNDAHQEFRSKVEELSGGIETAKSGLEDLDQRAVNFDNAIGETMSGLLDAEETLGDSIEEASDEASGRINETTEAMAEFLDDFDESLESVTDAVDDLLTSTIEDIGERVEEVMAAALEAIAEQLDSLNAMIADEAVPRVTQEVAATLVSNLTGLIDELLATFREALGGFRTQLFESSSETAQSRATVELTLDQMKVLMDPIQAEISRIRGLASSVGMGF